MSTIKITEYDAATGRIIATRELREGAFDPAAIENAFVEGHFPAATHCIVDGAPVEKPARPSHWHEWDDDARQWIEPPDSYATKRRAEYPPIADQLDALWKGGAAAEAMRATVLAVKTKYPKE